MKIFQQTKTPKLFAILALAVTATAFTSCKDDNNDVEPNSTASIRVVNAVEGSASQELYLDNARVSTSAVAYTKVSDYVKTKAGSHSAQLRNDNSATANVSFNVDLDSDKRYTVYYTGNADAKAAVVLKDETSAPSSGKAKVRFVHLSAAAASKIDLAITAGTKLITDLAYKASTAYQEVDANTTFLLYASGSTTVGLNMPTTVKAGKIYTIYVSGNTAATISYHVIAEN